MPSYIDILDKPWSLWKRKEMTVFHLNKIYLVKR